MAGIGFKLSAIGTDTADSGDDPQTLSQFMGKGGQNVGDELVILFSHLEYACKKIAALVASPYNSSLAKNFSAAAGSSERDKPKPLDIVAVRLLLVIYRVFYLKLCMLLTFLDGYLFDFCVHLV